MAFFNLLNQIKKFKSVDAQEMNKIIDAINKIYNEGTIANGGIGTAILKPYKQDFKVPSNTNLITITIPEYKDGSFILLFENGSLKSENIDYKVESGGKIRKLSGEWAMNTTLSLFIFTLDNNTLYLLNSLYLESYTIGADTSIVEMTNTVFQKDTDAIQLFY